MPQFEIESKYSKLNATIIEINQTYQQLLLDSYSNVFHSGRAASARTSGGNFCSLSDWETAASSKAADSGLTLLM